MNNNFIVTVTGPSGAGKTSILRKIMNLELLSFTTRPMREGEVNGKDYLFINPIEFDWMLANEMLAEQTKYGDNMYGLTKEEVHRKLSLGNAFFVCDYNGYQQIKEQYGDSVVSIFLYTSKEECAQNMRSRGDSEESIIKRLALYDNEIANKGHFDYVVKNNRGLSYATEHIIRAIINSEQLRRM